MRKLCSTLTILAAALSCTTLAMAQPTSTTPKSGAAPAAPANSSPSSTFTTDKDKASYAIGMNIGKSMKRDGLDLDTNLVMQGFKDAMSGAPSKMTDAEVQEAMTKLRNDVMARREQDMQREGEASKKAGDQFLAANKGKEGVVTLPDGLQYKVLKEGTGPKPRLTDQVVCNYRGTLLDGTEFDSSYKRGKPETFGVNQVIKGWTEALMLMPIGSKWQLFIPPDLAYGEKGAGNMIPPNSTLIFEVELLSVKGE